VAPDFRLPKGPEGELSLSDLRGQPVVLVFYPADWSPVCGDQLALYNEVLAEFARYNAQLLAISVDGPWCHAAYSKNRKIEFPLLSDSEPKGKVAQAYGVYRGADGLTERALFLIDAEGIIRWSYVSMIDVNPGAEGILEELEKLPKAGEARGV
jgi:peroxiredoxin